MRVLLRNDDFSAKYYELGIGNTALEFKGDHDEIVLPYVKIDDFYITCNQQNKTYFTVISENESYDGQIFESTGVESFAESIKEKLNGIINIEIKAGENR